MFITSPPSSRSQSSACLHYVRCMHTNISPSCEIQQDLVPVARVGVCRARMFYILCSLVLKQTSREPCAAIFLFVPIR